MVDKDTKFGTILYKSIPTNRQRRTQEAAILKEATVDIWDDFEKSLNGAAMNKDFARKLVDALESGNYKQAFGRLVKKDGLGFKYCCLGVACVVDGLSPILSDHNHEGAPEYLFHDRGCLDSGGGPVYLPSSVQAHSGLNCCGLLSFKDKGGSPLSLSALNDEGMSFHQIADIIRYEADII